MPAHNFSPKLLQRVPERLAVVEVSGVRWSDWGTPERIAHTLRHIGWQPIFQLDCLDPPFMPIAHVQAEGKVLPSF